MKRFIGSGILFVALIPTPLLGQSVRLGVGVGKGTLTGKDIRGDEAGFTVGGDLLLLRSGGLQVGLALDYSRYGVHLPEDLTEINVLGVLQYMSSGEAVQLFWGGKAGVSRHSVPLVTQTLMLTETSTYGLTAGPTVGLVVPVGEFGIEIGLDAMYMIYGALDPDEGAAGAIHPGSAYSGFRITGRVGLSITLGS